MAALGGVGVIAPAAWGMFTRRLPPFEEPPRTPAEDREVLVEGLAELGGVAGELGVALLLEPLNRYEDHMVNTVAQAAALIADAGARGLGILADTYHMNIEEDDLCASLGSVVPVLGAVHLSDSNRAQPGTGHVPFERVIATLRDDRMGRRAVRRVPPAGGAGGGRARVRRLPARARWLIGFVANVNGGWVGRLGSRGGVRGCISPHSWRSRRREWGVCRAYRRLSIRPTQEREPA